MISGSRIRSEYLVTGGVDPKLAALTFGVQIGGTLPIGKDPPRFALSDSSAPAATVAADGVGCGHVCCGAAAAEDAGCGPQGSQSLGNEEPVEQLSPHRFHILECKALLKKGIFDGKHWTYFLQHSSMADLMADKLSGPPMTLATCSLVSMNDVVRGET